MGNNNVFVEAVPGGGDTSAKKDQKQLVRMFNLLTAMQPNRQLTTSKDF